MENQSLPPIDHLFAPTPTKSVLELGQIDPPNSVSLSMRSYNLATPLYLYIFLLFFYILITRYLCTLNGKLSQPEHPPWLVFFSLSLITFQQFDRNTLIFHAERLYTSRVRAFPAFFPAFLILLFRSPPVSPAQRLFVCFFLPTRVPNLLSAA